MLKEGVVLGDGGMIIEARWRGYPTPGVILESPEALRQIHTDFFRAGSQALQALTWWTSRTQLERRDGWGDRLDEITQSAIRLAKEATGGEAPVGGCLNQTAAGSWTGPFIFDPDNAEARDRACAEWDEHIAAMVAAEVDFLIPETFSRLDEARLCLSRCKRTKVPTMVLMGGGGRSQDGVPMAECARILAAEGADIVGQVCGDMARMFSTVLEMRQAVDIPVAYQPGGYRRAGPNTTAIREAMLVSGKEMAEYALKAKSEGINYIGACCAAGPEHIRAMAQALGCERYPVV
jgi:betaine-homocysteine S-methyltransferase